MFRVLLAVGLLLSLAACGGGSDGLNRNEEKALEERLAQAEAERAKAIAEKAIADADRARAEAAKAAAEAARATAEAEKVEADAARVAAELVAEALRQAAEAARDTAETAQQEANEAAEARARAEAEAAAVNQAQLEAEAARARMGLADATLILTDTVTVTADYRAPARVSVPGTTFNSPTGTPVGRWYATRVHTDGAANEDTIVVYSDVGPDVPTPIKEAHRSTNPFAGHPTKTYTDDGNFVHTTVAGTDDANYIKMSTPVLIGHSTNIPVNQDTDETTGPDATSPISGSFDGVSGTFRCSAAPADDACSVRNTGAGYVLGDGTWTFRTSKNATVKIADANFMYFGWWRRRPTATDTFRYQVFSDPAAALTGDGFDALGDSATYEGPAIGHYAIHPPLGTNLSHGEFNATARFTANFVTNRLSGTVSISMLHPVGPSLSTKNK